jgi:hypothetical protein
MNSYIYIEKVLQQEKFRKQEEITQKYNDVCKTCFDKDIFDEMVDIVSQITKEERELDRSNLYAHSHKNFMEALECFGAESNHIWYYQKRYNTKAMRYLIMKHKNISGNENNKDNHNIFYDFLIKNEYLPIPDDRRNIVVNNFGMECASDRWCNLKIEEVPQYIEWNIKEYDGKEHIILG